jgi:ligand-binding sensor domain-containing protein
MWFGTYEGGLSRFDGVSYENFTRKNGLPSNRIQVLYSDNNGILWIGTEDEGLIKYNGKKFVKYGLEEGLLSNTVTSIINDDQGKLWAGTSEGINIIDGDSLYAFDKNDQLINSRVLTILKTKEKGLWIGTPKGVSIYQNGKMDSLDLQDARIGKFIRTMFQDEGGDIWLGSPRGVGRLSDGKYAEFFQDGGRGNNWIESINEDNSGKVWIGTRGGGVFIYADDSFTQINDKNGLNSNAVLSIFKNSDGILWLGTVGGGVNKYMGDSFVHFGKEQGLSHDLVFPIIEDNQENIWLGTFGGGINKFDPKDGSLDSYDKSDGLSGDNVFSIVQTNNNELWAGTLNGLNYFDGKKFSPHPKYEGVEIWSLFEDNDGSVWVGTHNGVVKEKNLKQSFQKPAAHWGKNQRSDDVTSVELNFMDDHVSSVYFSKTNGFTNSSVYSISKDSQGNYWFGTDSDGIYKYDGDQFTSFNSSKGVPTDYITSSTVDPDGTVWFGSDAGLIGIIDDEVIILDEEDGLSSNTVNSVTVDDNGTIWISTILGINRIELDKDHNLLDVIIYGDEEGFSSIETNDGSGIMDSKGNLWFGTIGGATRVNPESLLQDPFDTKIHLSRIKLFFDEVDWNDFAEGVTPWFNLPIDLALEHDQNQLTFEFIGINLKIPENVRYQWKLEGFDKEWSPATDKREANYTNIPPGEYTFIVKATNELGIWSESPVSFPFKIDSPIWLRWWFILLIVSSVVLLIRWFISFRLNSIRKVAAAQSETLNVERMMIASERKALRAQINPHFIFNVLNSIQYYIQDNEPLVASRHLSKFAKLMRMILENSKSSALPIADELESLKLYMDLEILRTEYKFDYEIVIDESIDVNECQIPPMLIQPFIENSIRHGIIPNDKNGRILLDLKLENEVIICAIEDDGVGINSTKKNKEDSDHVSSGMQITGDRLEILNMKRDNKMNFSIVDLESEGRQGTRVEIHIPLEN